MTQIEYDALFSALSEGQRIAEKPFHETITACKRKQAELWSKIRDLKSELSDVYNQQREAGLQCAQVRDDFKARRNELRMQWTQEQENKLNEEQEQAS